MSTPHVHLAHTLNLLLLALAPAQAAVAADAERSRTDAYGDPLPAGALARLGTKRFRVDGYSSACALSPDGKVLALAGHGEWITLLDVATGKELRRFRSDRNLATAAAFSPDSKLLATAGHGGLSVYNAATGEPLGRFENPGRGGARSVLFSADSKRVSVGGEGYGQKVSVGVWDVATKQKVASFDVLHDHGVQVALSADGKVLASWGQNLRGNTREHHATLQLWDVNTGKEIRQLKVPGYVPTAAAFSPDGKRLVVAESMTALGVWDVGTGKVVGRLAARRGTALVGYSPDGGFLAAGTHDGVVQLWDAVTGRRLGLSQTRPCRLGSIAFLPGGKVLAAGLAEQAVCVWEVSPGRDLTPRDAHPGAVGAVGFSRDGKAVLTAACDGARVWEAATGKGLRHITPPTGEGRQPDGSEGGRYCTLSPDGKYLLCQNLPHDEGLQVVDLADGEHVCDLMVNRFYRDLGVPGAFAADGTTFAALTSGPPQDSWGPGARVWDLSSGREIWGLKAPLGDQHNRLALSLDGKVMAAAAGARGRDEPGKLRLWVVATGKELGAFTLPDDGVTALAFSPDGALLAAGEQGGARLYDAAGGPGIRLLRGRKVTPFPPWRFPRTAGRWPPAPTTRKVRGPGSCCGSWRRARSAPGSGATGGR
jgi:WD40 repeat protein